MGGVRALLLVGRTNLALLLIRRGQAEDRGEILQHLRWSQEQARRLGLPMAGQIAGILASLDGRK